MDDKVVIILKYKGREFIVSQSEAKLGLIGISLFEEGGFDVSCIYGYGFLGIVHREQLYRALDNMIKKMEKLKTEDICQQRAKQTD